MGVKAANLDEMDSLKAEDPELIKAINQLG